MEKRNNFRTCMEYVKTSVLIIVLGTISLYMLIMHNELKELAESYIFSALGILGIVALLVITFWIGAYAGSKKKAKENKKMAKYLKAAIAQHEKDQQTIDELRETIKSYEQTCSDLNKLAIYHNGQKIIQQTIGMAVPTKVPVKQK